MRLVKITRKTVRKKDAAAKPVKKNTKKVTKKDDVYGDIVKGMQSLIHYEDLPRLLRFLSDSELDHLERELGFVKVGLSKIPMLIRKQRASNAMNRMDK